MQFLTARHPSLHCVMNRKVKSFYRNSAQYQKL